MSEDGHDGTSNIVLFDKKKNKLNPHNISTVLVFSVRQDFNGCDCVDHPRALEEIVLIHSYV